jgi:hypothetical protein
VRIVFDRDEERANFVPAQDLEGSER